MHVKRASFDALFIRDDTEPGSSVIFLEAKSLLRQALGDVKLQMVNADWVGYLANREV